MPQEYRLWPVARDPKRMTLRDTHYNLAGQVEFDVPVEVKNICARPRLFMVACERQPASFFWLEPGETRLIYSFFTCAMVKGEDEWVLLANMSFQHDSCLRWFSVV
jgi:hypothetical protein